jgi:hypothetical protein
MKNKNTNTTTTVTYTQESKPEWMQNGKGVDIMNEDGTCTIQGQICQIIYGDYPGGGFADVYKFGPFCGGNGYVNLDRLAAPGSLPKKAAPAIKGYVRPLGF